jgi:quercetin dioxygenase-like cupin family protein
MALEHHRPLQAIDVRPLGTALADAVTSSLLKIDELQLMRVVLRQGDALPEHAVDGAVTLLCLEGKATVTVPSGVRELPAGHVLVLPPGEPHAVMARQDCSLLITLLFGGAAAPG